MKPFKRLLESLDVALSVGRSTQYQSVPVLGLRRQPAQPACNLLQKLELGGKF